MKYEVTAEDRQIMESDLATDRTLKHLKNISFYKFSVGDVLIREEKCSTWNGNDTKFEWRVRTAECDLPYKYVYVFENELGVGYIRRLSVNGRKFVERPICVTEFDPDQTRFILDPDYADHMLLAGENDEFDAKTRYAEIKKKREQIHRKNKKIAVSLPDEAATIKWIKTLKVGDKFWYGHSIGNIHKEPYTIQEIVLTEPSGYNTPYRYGAHQPHFTPYIKATMTNSVHASSFYADTLIRYYVFMQRPTFMDEVIN